MSGHCVAGDHGDCPDTTADSGLCSCTCHPVWPKNLATTSSASRQHYIDTGEYLIKETDNA